MSGELQQSSTTEELLHLVRSCKHYLMWQREQGWDGVPRGDSVRWGTSFVDDPVTRLLLESPASSSQQHPSSTGQPPSRQSKQAQRQAEHPPGPGLELMRDVMGSIGLPQEERQSKPTTQAPTRQRQQAPSQRPTSPPMEVIRIEPEVVAREPALPLQVLRDLPEQELMERQLSWEAVMDSWRSCERCPRAHGRSQVVIGEGPLHSRVMLVSEGPSTSQDKEGSFWEGERGKMLSVIVQAIGISPQDIYLTAVVHCFRAQPTVPQKQEIEACFPLLEQEISIVQPEFIVTLGAVATQSLLRVTKRLAHLRGSWHQHHNNSMVFPTYSPAYLLKRPAYKGMAWEDWQAIRTQLIASGCQTS